MRQYTDENIIFLGTSTPEAAFTAATTDIITSNSHGLQNGDLIQVTTTGTLPGGLTASTNYYVIDATANTFKVSATPNGPAVNITSAGTGTHTYHLKGKVIYVADWVHNIVSLHFIGTPTMTVKFQGSIANAAPDFNKAQSYDNSWDYVEVLDLEDGTAIDGDTGISCSGVTDDRLLEVNTSGLKWLTVAITDYTAGKLDVRVVNFGE